MKGAQKEDCEAKTQLKSSVIKECNCENGRWAHQKNGTLPNFLKRISAHTWQTPTRNSRKDAALIPLFQVKQDCTSRLCILGGELLTKLFAMDIRQ